MDLIFGSLKQLTAVRGLSDVVKKTLVPRNLTLKKYEIVHALATKYSYHSYLEICTPTTGNFYHRIDRSKFKQSYRLMYNCPTEFNDGLPIDYRIGGLDIAPVIASLSESNSLIDVCLVDSWHTYEHSLRDLRVAYDLLADGGALIVHDCVPPSPRFASPGFQPGAWSGLTYKAYIDFIHQNDLDSYFTIDTDFGCGVIYKNRDQPFANKHRASASDRIRMREALAEAGENYYRTYRLVFDNRTEWLNVISVNQFLRQFGDSIELPRRRFLRLSSPVLTRVNSVRWKLQRNK